MFRKVMEFLGFAIPELPSPGIVTITNVGTPKMYGTGNWTKGREIFLSHFRKGRDCLVADVSMMDPRNYYINKRGHKCYPYTEYGTIEIYKDGVHFKLNLRDKFKELIRGDVKRDDKGNIILDFSKDYYVRRNCHEI